MALTKVTRGGIGADAIDGSKIADDTINSEHFVDAGIDNAHLANDAIGVEEISATGTASSSTFLRGDNSWQVVDSLPSQSSQSGKYLTTNGSAASWATITAGGPSLGTSSIIRTNAQTISENITIGSTTNGMSAGPITIADSYTVTVNGNWSIV